MIEKCASKWEDLYKEATNDVEVDPDDSIADLDASKNDDNLTTNGEWSDADLQEDHPDD